MPPSAAAATPPLGSPFPETVFEDRLTARNGVVIARDCPGHGLVFRPDARESHRLM